jgi:hypothetical protein
MADKTVIEEMPLGYWLYEDGRSFWGINVVRFGKFGIPISFDLHRSDDTAAKIAAYAKAEAEIAAASKATKPKAWGDGTPTATK